MQFPLTLLAILTTHKAEHCFRGCLMLTSGLSYVVLNFRIIFGVYVIHLCLTLSRKSRGTTEFFFRMVAVDKVCSVRKARSHDCKTVIYGYYRSKHSYYLPPMLPIYIFSDIVVCVIWYWSQLFLKVVTDWRMDGIRNYCFKAGQRVDVS